MIPPCRYCNGYGGKAGTYQVLFGPEPCPRCQGSQLDEAWHVTLAPLETRPGFARVTLAYGAHAATRHIADAIVDETAADLLSDVLGGRIRRGLILRDKR